MNKYCILGNGNSVHTLKWIKELKKYYDVYLISFEDVSEAIYEELGGDKIFVFTNYQLFKKVRVFLYVNKIKKLLNKINPAVINAHYVSSYGVVAALAKPNSVKLISSAWGSDILVFPQKSFMHTKAINYVLKKSDLITSDANCMTDEIIRINNNSKEKTVTFGFFDAQVFLQDFVEIPKQKIIFSNRGLEKNYNINVVIEWFAKQDKEYSLVVANEGSELANLKKLTRTLGVTNRVSFVGTLTKETQKLYYAKSEYYITIPTSDATSVSLLEAMTAKCIPIVSSISANRELIIDKYNGYHFEDKLTLPQKIDSQKGSINRGIILSMMSFSDAIKKIIVARCSLIVKGVS